MGMTATARRIGNGLECEVDVNGRHTIVTDEPERLGGSDLGPAPHELLAAALAACVATTIAAYAQNRSWRIGEASVEVNYDHESVPRRLDIEIVLPAELDRDQVRRLERVARTCPLRRSLEAGFLFEERLSAGSPTAPDAAARRRRAKKAAQSMHARPATR